MFGVHAILIILIKIHIQPIQQITLPRQSSIRKITSFHLYPLLLAHNPVQITQMRSQLKEANHDFMNILLTIINLLKILAFLNDFIMIFQILYHIKFPSVRIRCYHNRPIIKKMRYLLSLKAAAHFF